MSSGPKTIEDFGYGFNTKGQLRQLDKKTKELTDKPFEFEISDKHAENQKHYEALGEAITDHVYGLLETQSKLIRMPVPNTSSDDIKSFCFASTDALTNPDKLLLIIHGSGVVRAGQWARSLIMNDNLESGTQLSYIDKAKSLGYGIIVTNTNDNQRAVDGRKYLIAHSSTPEEHGESVWNSYVTKSSAKFIAIVAHSYGGIITVGLAQKFPEFSQKVKAIAMTDSVHSFQRDGTSSDVEVFLKKVGKNWVTSHDPLDAPQKSPDYEIPRVSAGVAKHEMTSHSAINSVFEFLEQKYLEV